MARVICELDNASDEISGVKFTEDRGQMISEEIDDAVAERFAKVPGYKLVKTQTAKEQKAAEAKAAEDAAAAKAAEEPAAAKAAEEEAAKVAEAAAAKAVEDAAAPKADSKKK